jgi:hypothetical protein
MNLKTHTKDGKKTLLSILSYRDLSPAPSLIVLGFASGLTKLLSKQKAREPLEIKRQ